MEELRLRVIYDPILRQKAHPVELFDSGLKAYADQMIEIMQSHHGLGLAAPQVGLDKRLFVFGYQPKDKDDEIPNIPFTALVNPRIIKSSKEKETMTEGCLSLPGLELPVLRSSGVTVEAFDLEGKSVTLRAKGLVARIIQHEIDHLDGVLFTDRADNFKNIADYKFARILFFGSDEFSLPIFRTLIENGLNITAAITETDKAAGRGLKIVSSPIKLEAESAGIAVIQPETKEEITEIVSQLQPDLIILASYGKILPPEALDLSVYGALNVHPSLLPKYRGATPIQSAILNGDDRTGVTIMEMAAGVDTGGIVEQDDEPITTSDTTETLKIKLADLGAQLLLKAIPAYIAGQSKIEHQDESDVVKTYKLTKEMGQIDWNKPLEIIDREIRAYYPWPGAYTDLQGKRLKLLGSHLVAGRLMIDRVQLEGKQPSNWADFQRGYAHLLNNTDWYSKIS